MVGEVLAVMQDLLNQDDNGTVTHEMGFAYEVADRVIFYGWWCYCRRREHHKRFSIILREDRIKGFLSKVL